MLNCRKAHFDCNKTQLNLLKSIVWNDASCEYWIVFEENLTSEHSQVFNRFSVCILLSKQRHINSRRAWKDWQSEPFSSQLQIFSCNFNISTNRMMWFQAERWPDDKSNVSKISFDENFSPRLLEIKSFDVSICWSCRRRSATVKRMVEVGNVFTLVCCWCVFALGRECKLKCDWMFVDWPVSVNGQGQSERSFLSERKSWHRSSIYYQYFSWFLTNDVTRRSSLARTHPIKTCPKIE